VRILLLKHSEQKEKDKMKYDKAQGFIAGLIFVFITISLALIGAYGVWILNIWLIVVGFVGVGAWIYAGRHII
jgi:Na+/H+ antiporter NhaB